MSKKTEKFLNGLFGAILLGMLTMLLIMSTSCASRWTVETAPDGTQKITVEPAKDTTRGASDTQTHILDVRDGVSQNAPRTISDWWTQLAALVEAIGLLRENHQPPTRALHEHAMTLLETAGELREIKPAKTKEETPAVQAVKDRADEALAELDKLPEVKP